MSGRADSRSTHRPLSAGSAPLAGLRVAVTRQQRGELDDLLVAAGAEVVHVPLIEIDEAPGDELDLALERLARYAWVLVTSVAGAERVGRAAAGEPAVRLGAVGTATAARFAALAGREVDAVPGRQTAGDLARRLGTPGGSSRRVLVAQADRAAATLADSLRAAGWDVDVVTAYVTRLRRPTVDEIDRLVSCDAVLFASGSAATSWRAALGDRATAPDAPSGFAIGPTTAAAARQEGLKIEAVAADHSLAGLVDALIRWRAGRSDGPLDPPG